MTIERVEFHNRQNMKAFGSHRDRMMAGTNVRAWDLAVPQMGRRNFSFANWAALKHRIAASAAADELEHAIRANDRETVVKVLRAKPELLHLPVWSGNWGPPMSHAANLGRLEIIQAVAALGARDFQHAFDRAVLQGQIACARWLHEHGAKLAPGIIMGASYLRNTRRDQRL